MNSQICFNKRKKLPLSEQNPFSISKLRKKKSPFQNFALQINPFIKYNSTLKVYSWKLDCEKHRFVITVNPK